MFCTRCGASILEGHNYCPNCGVPSRKAADVPARPTVRSLSFPVKSQPPASPRRFLRLFGLDPRIAVLTLIVDVMLNAGDLATMGLLLPVSIMAGIVLGYIVYKGQIAWYGDDKESARIKAVALGLLTAIPTPLPELLYIPAGLVGLLHGFRKKESHS